MACGLLERLYLALLFVCTYLSHCLLSGKGHEVLQGTLFADKFLHFQPECSCECSSQFLSFAAELPRGCPRLPAHLRLQGCCARCWGRRAVSILAFSLATRSSNLCLWNRSLYVYPLGLATGLCVAVSILVHRLHAGHIAQALTIRLRPACRSVEVTGCKMEPAPCASGLEALALASDKSSSTRAST